MHSDVQTHFGMQFSKVATWTCGFIDNWMPIKSFFKSVFIFTCVITCVIKSFFKRED